MARKRVEKEPPQPLDGGYIPVDDDPLASILGPGSATVLGNQGEEIPEEILDVFQQHELSSCQFRCILKQIPEGATDQTNNLAFVKGWTRAVPTLDYIAREYGPGQYKMVFMWRTKDGDQRTVTKSDNVVFEVSEKYAREYRNYQFEKRLKDMEKKRELVRDLRMDNELEKGLGFSTAEDEKEKVNVEEAAVKYVDNVTAMAQKLGLSKPQGINWGEILPLLATGVPAIMKVMQDSANARREENREFMTLLISTMSNNSNQMLDVLKAQQPQRGADLTREMFDMIKGAMDVKEMINGAGKDSVADRIFNLIETVAPQLLAVANLSAHQRAMDPRAAIARTYMQSDKDFQAMRQNPEILAEVVRRMDKVLGWAQTDAVLAAIQMERPESAPRDPALEKPVDERTEIQEAQVQPDIGEDENPVSEE